MDGPLFLADTDRFRTRMHELAGLRPRTIGVGIDAEAVHLTDTNRADIAVQVAQALAADGVGTELRRDASAMPVERRAATAAA